MKSTKGQIRHEYNIITDICEKCGVHMRKVPITTDGFNPTLKNMNARQYSRDGIIWETDYINCIKRCQEVK